MPDSHDLHGSYDTYSPEISRYARQGRFTCHTLRTLGLKRSSQAQDSGYFLIRHTNVNAKMPAYWLHPDDAPAYRDCLREIKTLREQQALLQAHRQAKQSADTMEKLAGLDDESRKIYHQLTQSSAFKHRSQNTLVTLAKRHCKAKARFEGWQTHLPTGCIAIRFDVSLDDSVTLTRATLVFPIDVSRPYDGRFVSNQEFVIDVKNTITQKGWALALESLTHRVECYKSALQRISGLAKEWREIGVRRAFDTLFIKVINGATSPGDLLSGLKDSLHNDPDGLQAIYSRIATHRACQDHPAITINTRKLANEDETPPSIFRFHVAPGIIVDAALLNVIASVLLSPPGGNAVDTLATGITNGLDALLAQLRLEMQRSLPDTEDQLKGKLHDLQALKLAGQHNLKSWRKALTDTHKYLTDILPVLTSLWVAEERWGDPWVASRFCQQHRGERHIVIYAGPTNSGKTHHAFADALKDPDHHVIYLAPLRLLAMEGYDRFVSHGESATLITGEERLGEPGSRCIAATVEMLNPEQSFDVAIIDEAQMLTDPDRGAAWTQALLGVNADSVYLTCPEEAIPMITAAIALTGDRITIKRHQRKSSLQIIDKPVKLNAIGPRSAVIAFSRRDLLSYKRVFENAGKKCSLLYGALSPDVRREQSARFTQGETDILLATDAIAMGLNLPIDSIYLSTAVKFDGKKEGALSRALITQIAGRAGRYGISERGYIGAFDPHTLKRIQEAMAKPVSFHLPKFYLALDQYVVTWLSAQLKTSSLLAIKQHFKAMLSLSKEPFKIDDNTTQDDLMRHLDGLGYQIMPLNTRFLLSCAPVNKLNHNFWCQAVIFMFRETSLSCPTLPLIVTQQDSKHGSEEELNKLESAAAELMLYRWLHYRFPVACPEIDKANAQLNTLNEAIMAALDKKIRKLCKSCKCEIPLNLPHAYCDPCHTARRQRFEDDDYPLYRRW